jgi:hypothetical protein
MDRSDLLEEVLVEVPSQSLQVVGRTYTAGKYIIYVVNQVVGLSEPILVDLLDSQPLILGSSDLNLHMV